MTAPLPPERTYLDSDPIAPDINLLTEAIEELRTLVGEGGGGSLAQAYKGTDAVGATYETAVTRTVYMKKITLTAPGLLTDIEVYGRHQASEGAAVAGIGFGLYADNAGAPREFLGHGGFPAIDTAYFKHAVSTLGNARWIGGAFARWLTAGDYWIAVFTYDSGLFEMALNTTGGSDRTYQSGGTWQSDAGYTTVTTTAKNYSIRATVLTPSSGSGTAHDRRWVPAAAHAQDDEFRDDTLSASWTLVTPEASRAEWSEAGDVLSVRNNGGDSAAQLHAQMRAVGTALVAGEAIQTCLTLLGPWKTDFAMGGLVLADGASHGSGNQLIALSLIGVDGWQASDLRSFTGYNSGGGSSTARNVNPGPLHLRVVMTAANTWRLDHSLDGVSWILGTATVSRTLTPTHVGLLSSSWGTATKSVCTYEYFRRVSGVS